MRTIKRTRKPVEDRIELDFWTRLGNHLAQFDHPPPAGDDALMVRAALGVRFQAQLKRQVAPQAEPTPSPPAHSVRHRRRKSSRKPSPRGTPARART